MWASAEGGTGTAETGAVSAANWIVAPTPADSSAHIATERADREVNL
jgi:hypothetical protein